MLQVLTIRGHSHDGCTGVPRQDCALVLHGLCHLLGVCLLGSLAHNRGGLARAPPAGVFGKRGCLEL